ncbi:phosphotransferase family protein [Natronolimnohabitans innermongolicus]|uniref:Aminoglycoside phosphotransferase n=1 Tax=Natronolimnohabitans innermongolicus JCM 12255 TaxID=1227499 RepID=L9XLQ1_9EURY|nr:phosphotransferase [Natronolimnohabitans innermongolicus]ELY61578.1 aminoglycoside phosphotransferase [Natronolimnohabitans innermongolicus JCM 12255]
MIDPIAAKNRDTDPLTDEQIENCLRATEMDWTLERSEAISEGSETTYQIEVIDETNATTEVIFKTAGLSSTSEFVHEPRIHRFVATETNIPVPSIYTAVTDPELVDRPFYLMEYIDGSSLESDEEWIGTLEADCGPDALAGLARTAGRHLAQLHELGPVEGVGKLTVGDDGIVIKDNSTAWGDWMRGSLDSPYLEYLGEIESDVRDYIREATATLPKVPLVPMHYDYRPGNLLVDADTYELKAVLDWGAVRSGHYEYELVLCEQYLTQWSSYDAERRSIVRENLYAGYERYRTLDRDAKFRDRRHLYQLVTRISALHVLPYYSETKQDRLWSHHWQFFKDVVDIIETAS